MQQHGGVDISGGYGTDAGEVRDLALTGCVGACGNGGAVGAQTHQMVLGRGDAADIAPECDVAEERVLSGHQDRAVGAQTGGEAGTGGNGGDVRPFGGLAGMLAGAASGDHGAVAAQAAGVVGGGDGSDVRPVIRIALARPVVAHGPDGAVRVEDHREAVACCNGGDGDGGVCGGIGVLSGGLRQLCGSRDQRQARQLRQLLLQTAAHAAQLPGADAQGEASAAAAGAAQQIRLGSCPAGQGLRRRGKKSKCGKMLKIPGAVVAAVGTEHALEGGIANGTQLHDRASF